LAGGIAHDFNNLLMAVLGNAELALQDISEVSPARPMLEEIRRTARRAADLCKQMLAYSGKGRFVVKPIDLSELVREMGHMLEVSISKKATMRYTLSPSLPAVDADATQMRQVIMNLLINASEALGEQNGVISIVTGSVDCDREYLQGMHLDENLPTGLYAYLEVSDTGCGMDAATVRRIFDPFFTTKFMGRGLGMAAVLGIVRGHKGAIKVYSEVGKGTTFKILLPALDVLPEPEESIIHETDRWRGSGLVLLVDDEETIRLLGQRMLERMGFSVVLASDGVEALEVYRARAHEITCVVLDLTMPNLDGEETFRELRRIDPKARVVMSSGYNQQDVVTRFVGRGLAGFVQKPYTIPELTAVMKLVLTQG
jgi:CheY-like chemotaxis protein